MKSGETIVIREERPEDIPAIRAVNNAAFGQPDEAVLVDALRVAGGVTLSLVAVDGDELVGHILFSPVEIEGAAERSTAVGLAPMAVSPARQGQGIGGRLIEASLERLRAAGERAVVLVGHPGYYPRFGFTPASGFGLRWDHEAPDAAFMAIELVPGALAACPGVVHYRPELDAVS